MGASTTPRTAESALHIAVATSGGRDSTALLHCAARAARGSALHVHALHVHHGLMSDADEWVEHLRKQIRRWAKGGLPITLHVQRLQEKPRPGESIEAWARHRRYAALASMAKAAGATTVWLAHHRQDQAETVLLQALRGAGAAGLSAMPQVVQRQGIAWCRPWLQQPRAAIDAYLRRHRLRWIEDQSNQNERYARSRLRQTLWPALITSFPDAETSLALVAARAQEAAACLAELAAIDRPGCVSPQGLDVVAWMTLSEARRSLLLRSWLTGAASGPVPQTLVQRLLDELPGARTGSWPWTGHSLRLYRDVLRIETRAATAASVPASVAVDLQQPGAYPVEGWHGHLVVAEAPGPGINPAELAQAECRARSGRERFQFRHGSQARSLKKQYQSMGVPAWQRHGPLVYLQGRLALVPGLGVDARVCQTAPGAGMSLRWEPAAQPDTPQSRSATL